MGFFNTPEPSATRVKTGGQHSALLHRMECRACPLDNAPCMHPKMPASGAREPTVYILGEAPGGDEDSVGRQFVGDSGQVLRLRLPKAWLPFIRWNNVVRTRPPKNRDPTDVEIECCRPSVVKDIEASQPTAVFGMGNIPLHWVLGLNGISQWRGRRMPVKIGTHTCWFYPMLHPSYILRTRKRPVRSDADYGSALEHAFAFDLKRALDEVGTLPAPVVHTADEARAGIECVTGRQSGDLQRVVAFLASASARRSGAGVDYETSHKRPYHADSTILTAAVSLPDHTMAFAMDHREAGWSKLDRQVVDEAWKAFLLSDNPKLVHNLAFELEWNAVFYGGDTLRRAPWHDTMSQAVTLDERVGKSKDPIALWFLTTQYFGIDIKALSNLDKARMASEPLDKILPYNGMDAKYHRLLFGAQDERIVAEGLERAYDDMVRRVPTTVLTQVKGIDVDTPTVIDLNKKYKKRIAAAEETIFASPHVLEFRRRTGKIFQPGSGPDNVILIRDILGKNVGTTKKGGDSVNAAVLSGLKDPIGKALLTWRRTSKLKSTYNDGMMPGGEYMYPDGKMHPILNAIGPETGRLSSEDPNEQNFPKRSEEGKEVRKQIVAPPGYLICALDYGQIEARVIAMATRDPVFVKMLWDRYDVHADWAKGIAEDYPARIGGRQFLDDKDAMAKFRDEVKGAFVFASFFGAWPKTVGERLGIPEDVATRQQAAFWKVFKASKQWQDKSLVDFNQLGYIELMTGRRRRAPLSSNQIFNTPIQGATADIVLDAMCRVSEMDDWDLQPIMNIHDDLTFYFPLGRAEYLIRTAVETMLAVPFDFVNVPIQVEVSVSAHNWYDMHFLGKYNSDIALPDQFLTPEFLASLDKVAPHHDEVPTHPSGNVSAVSRHRTDR